MSWLAWARWFGERQVKKPKLQSNDAVRPCCRPGNSPSLEFAAKLGLFPVILSEGLRFSHLRSLHPIPLITKELMDSSGLNSR